MNMISDITLSIEEGRNIMQACRAVLNSLNETRAQQTLLKVIVEIIKIADSD